MWREPQGAGCRVCGAGALPRAQSALVLRCPGRQPCERARAKAFYSGPRGPAGVGGAATRPSPALQAYATVTVKPSGPTRLLKVGAVVLISGAVLLLFGAIGAFYFWKGSDSHVSSKSGSRGCPPEWGCKDRQVRWVAEPLGAARAPASGHELLLPLVPLVLLERYPSWTQGTE